MANKTVSTEPTKEMLIAGQRALDDCVDEDYDSDMEGNRNYYTTIRSDAVDRVWRAMIAVVE